MAVLMAVVISEDYESKEINGSQIMGQDFAPVNLIVRFIRPARIIASGQIMSS